MRPLSIPRLRVVGIGALAIGLSGTLGYVLAGRAIALKTSEPHAWNGNVVKVLRGGDKAGPGLTARSGATSTPLADGAAVPVGSVVATDGKTQARVDFDDGSQIVIDRASELSLRADMCGFEAKDASIVLAVGDGKTCLVKTPSGEVRAKSGRFAITATEGRTSVEAMLGEAEIGDGSGAALRVAVGEEGVLARGARPEVTASTDFGQRALFGEKFVARAHNEDADGPVRGLGELRAKKPGAKEEKDRAVRLARHDVKVRIVGNVARTEIDESFANDSDDELEGIYRFPLPPNALIERLALEVDGKLVEGSFVDKSKGAAIWRGVLAHATPNQPKPAAELIWVPGPWRDPALLEWKRGGRAELRIFPIPKHGARRIVLSYTETIAPAAGVRRYVYPLPQSTASDLTIDSASFDVQVLGADPATPPRVRGYELGDGETKRQKTFTSFTPSGDLVIEYALPDAKSAMSAWAFAGPGDKGQEQLAMIALRPKLPSWGEAKPRDQVIVVDSGRAMFGERFKRASRLAVQIAQEMDRRDRVTVLACDVTCRSLAAGFEGAGAGAAHDVDAFLASVSPDGASDLVGAVRAASKVAGRDASRDLRVVVLSAGTASAGYRRFDRVSAEVASAMPDARASVVTVPIGTDADVDTLSAVARGGGGVVVPYPPGERLEAAALEVLGATYGVALRDVEVTLPDGLYDAAPAVIAPMRAGGETIVAARMRGDSVKGDVIVRGKVAGEAFEAKYPLDLQAQTGDANAFVPRQYAALRITDDERAGDAQKTEAIALSKRFAVPSKHTSLLVLESEAMFAAFGIDRTVRAPTWTGEVDAAGKSAPSTPGAGDDPADLRASAAEEAEKKKEAPMALGAGPAGGFADNARGAGGLGSYKAPPTDSPLAQAAPTATFAPPPPPSPAPKPSKNAFDDDKPMAAPPAPPPWADPRRRGRWMRREWFRVAQIAADEKPAVAADKLATARAALAAAPDARKSFLDLVRLLSRAGALDEMGDVVARWATRDPMDADLIRARAELLARAGDRRESLHVLGGVASAAPDDADSMAQLALANERAGERDAACAFRIARAELRPTDADAVGAAALCERTAGRGESADRWIGAAKDDAARAKIAAAVTKLAGGSRADVVFGDIAVDATWDAGVDLDLAIVDPSGRRASWASAVRGVRASDCTSGSHEALALSSFATGAYVIEVASAAPLSRPVRGTLRVTSLGTTRLVPFALSGSRAQVARVDVTMSSRLVPVAFQAF